MEQGKIKTPSNSSMKKTIVSIVAMTLVAALPLTGTCTGIPVLDVSNLLQNTTTALKQVQSYAQMVQSYQLQLQQYANQVKNTLGLGSTLQLWQQATSTMNSVMGVVNIFKSGNLQSTLSQFQNYNYWLTPPTGASYNPGAGSALQKTANDALFKNLSAQTAAIQADAANLQKLQSTASSAQGQMQAIQAAAQLAALEQQQLLQIRGLLVAEQQALGARQATLSNSEAIGAANTQNLLNANPSVSQPHTGWSPIQ
jgi:P-type conjugative transfer protein TrbJ